MSSSESPTVTITHENSILVRLIGSTFFSNVGDGLRIASYAIMAWELTHNAILTTLMSVSANIALLIFMPFAGVIADKMNRLQLLMLGNFGRTLMYLVIAGMIFVGLLSYWLLLISIFLLHVLEALTDTGLGALIPQIVKSPKKLERVNNLRISVVEISNGLLGPSIGALIVSWNQGYAILCTALLFFIGGLLILSVYFTNKQFDQKIEDDKISLRDFKHLKNIEFISEMKTAVQAILEKPFFLLLIISDLIFHLFAWMGFNVFVIYVEVSLDQPSWMYGFLWGTVSIGAIVFSSFIAIFPNLFSTRQLYLFAMILFSITSIGIFLTTNLILSFIILFFNGFPLVALFARLNTQAQILFPEHLLGKAYAAVWSAEIIAITLSSFLAGLITQISNAQVCFLISGIVIASYIPIFLFFSKKYQPVSDQ